MTRPWIVAALSFVGAIGYFWLRSQVLDAGEPIPLRVNHDLFAYYFPMFEYGFDRLLSGGFPLWNPYQAFGLPFFATQSGVFYPLNFPHLLFDAAEAITYVFLLHLLLAACFTFALGRTLGLSVEASIFSGCVFALIPITVLKLYNPGLLFPHVWVPLILLCGEKLFRSETLGWATALGLAFAVQVSAGYLPTVLLTGYGFGVFLLVRGLTWYRSHRSPRRLLRISGLLVLGAFVAIGLSAYHLVPSYELATHGVRSPGGYAPDQVQIGFTLPPLQSLRLFLDSDPFSTRPLHSGILRTQYVGIPVLLLAVLAWVNRRSRPYAVAFAVLAGAALLLSFGYHTPVYEWFYRLPTASLIRKPIRFLELVAVSVVILAGIGLDGFLRELRPAAGRRTLWGLLVFGALLLLVLAAMGNVRGLTLTACVIALVGSLHWLPSLPWRRLVALGVGVAAVVDVVGMARGGGLIPQQAPRVYERHGAVADQLRAAPERGRAYLASDGSYATAAKWGMWNRIAVASDYEPMTRRRFAQFASFLETGEADVEGRKLPFAGDLRLSGDSVNVRLARFASIRYFVARRADGDVPPGWERRHTAGTMAIYENPEALPRAYFAARAVLVPDPEDALALLAGDDFSPRREVVVEEPDLAARFTDPAPKDWTPPRVRITEYTPERVFLEVDTDAPGLVVLTDSFFPGWEAAVNGRPAALHRANMLFRAVAVPAGASTIEMTYRPRSVRVGLAISAGTAVVVVGLLASTRLGGAVRGR